MGMTEAQLLSFLNQNPFVLAPMAGITDRAFRSFMREMGCGVVVTELVSATGLKYNSEKTRGLMSFDPIQHPVGIQLFGEELEDLALAAKEVEAMGADFVDLNFGCPVPKVVKKGAGAAVLKDLGFLRKILSTVKSAVKIPVTIKIRTGWDESSRNAHEVVKVAAEEGITWVAIHGRTRAQGYSGASDWDYIRYVKSVSSIPVLGNGDIASGALANRRLQETLCDGVLIGRGCLKNPWIFREALAIYQGQQPPLVTTREFNLVFDRLLFHLHDEGRGSERIAHLQLKKFAAWYSAGYPESSAFRKQLFSAGDFESLKVSVSEYFDRFKDYRPKDTSDEPFLMGGHG